MTDFEGKVGESQSRYDVAIRRAPRPLAARASIDDILRAEKQLAFNLFNSLGVTLSPKEQAAVEQMPTRNVDAFLAYSRGVRFEAEGRYTAAAQEYRQAAGLDPAFKAAQAQLQGVQSAAATPAPTQQASAGAPQAARATELVNLLAVTSDQDKQR